MPTQKKTKKKKKTKAHSVDAMEVKSQEPEKEKEEDRISLLPDDLIVNEILPRLESTKYAIRTDNEVIADILSGTPPLVTLRLAGCYGYFFLHITSSSVKDLSICGYPDKILDDLVVGITAPYISSLSIMGTLYMRKMFLLDMSSLVKVDLDYYKPGHKQDREGMLESFIRNLHHVKELKIGIDCYKAFSRLEAKGFNSPSNLKVVDVTYQSFDTDSVDLSDYSDDDSSVDDTDSMERGDCSDNDSSFDDQDAEHVGDEGNPAAGREVGADDAVLGDDVGDVGDEEADVRHED